MRLITANRDIEIQAGDTLLIECEQRLTMEQATHLKERVKDTLGCNVVVFDGSIRVASFMDDAGTPIYDAVSALFGR